VANSELSRVAPA